MTVKVTLRHSLNKDKKLSYYINPDDNILAQDWLVTLKDDILKKNLYLEKNYCFLSNTWFWPSFNPIFFNSKGFMPSTQATFTPYIFGFILGLL